MFVFFAFLLCLGCVKSSLGDNSQELFISALNGNNTKNFKPNDCLDKDFPCRTLEYMISKGNKTTDQIFTFLSGGTYNVDFELDHLRMKWISNSETVATLNLVYGARLNMDEISGNFLITGTNAINEITLDRLEGVKVEKLVSLGPSFNVEHIKNCEFLDLDCGDFNFCIRGTYISDSVFKNCENDKYIEVNKYLKVENSQFSGLGMVFYSAKPGCQMEIIESTFENCFGIFRTSKGAVSKESENEGNSKVSLTNVETSGLQKLFYAYKTEVEVNGFNVNMETQKASFALIYLINSDLLMKEASFDGKQSTQNSAVICYSEDSITDNKITISNTKIFNFETLVNDKGSIISIESSNATTVNVHLENSHITDITTKASLFFVTNPSSITLKEVEITRIKASRNTFSCIDQAKVDIDDKSVIEGKNEEICDTKSKTCTFKGTGVDSVVCTQPGKLWKIIFVVVLIAVLCLVVIAMAIALGIVGFVVYTTIQKKKRVSYERM